MRQVFFNVGHDLIEELANYRKIRLKEKDINELTKILVRYTVGFGLIEVLLEDEKVQDITMNSPMGNIPVFIEITDGKVHDVNLLDVIIPEPGSFCIMDRGYIDFRRLYTFTLHGAFFVIRTKSNMQSRRLYSHPVDKSTGLKCDQTILLTGLDTHKEYPEKVRRVRYVDEETAKSFTFLTNNFILPALTIAQLYKCRWQIELFFKWIKQHLRIQAFYGTSENAVKTQIWIAISIYVLVAIVKKRLKLDISLYTFLHISNVRYFEKNLFFIWLQLMVTKPIITHFVTN